MILDEMTMCPWGKENRNKGPTGNEVFAVFTLNHSFYPKTWAVHPVSALISTAVHRIIYYTWYYNYGGIINMIRYYIPVGTSITTAVVTVILIHINRRNTSTILSCSFFSATTLRPSQVSRGASASSAATTNGKTLRQATTDYDVRGSS